MKFKNFEEYFVDSYLDKIFEQFNEPVSIEWDKTSDTWSGIFSIEDNEYKIFIKNYSKLGNWLFKFSCNNSFDMVGDLKKAFTVLPTIKKAVTDFWNEVQPEVLFFFASDKYMSRKRFYDRFCLEFQREHDLNYYTENHKSTQFFILTQQIYDGVEFARTIQKVVAGIGINESLGYTDFFGKTVSHEDALKKKVNDMITQIYVDTARISEKDFTRYDEAIDIAKSICENNPEIYTGAQDSYEQRMRLELYAERIFWEFFDMSKACNENLSDVEGTLERCRKIPKEMKEKILPKLSSSSRYDNGRVFNLTGWNLQKKGCSLGADKNGFFCYTHRARSKSYESPEKIPQKDVEFIESTG